MSDSSISATSTVKAPAQAVFSALADPGNHAVIGGGEAVGSIGWVQEAIDRETLSSVGQVFRMAMSHPDVPGGSYETVNRVRVFEPGVAVAWETGYDAGGGDLRFSGWFWRYDLVPISASETTVTLTYDWSAVQLPHPFLQFPPFPPDHLANSLGRLAGLMTS